jgi:hypothetical protein
MNKFLALARSSRRCLAEGGPSRGLPRVVVVIIGDRGVSARGMSPLEGGPRERHASWEEDDDDDTDKGDKRSLTLVSLAVVVLIRIKNK